MLIVLRPVGRLPGTPGLTFFIGILGTCLRDAQTSFGTDTTPSSVRWEVYEFAKLLDDWSSAVSALGSGALEEFYDIGIT